MCKLNGMQKGDPCGVKLQLIFRIGRIKNVAVATGEYSAARSNASAGAKAIGARLADN